MINNICFDLDVKCQMRRGSLHALFFHNPLINLLILLEFVINHFYLRTINEMHWDIIQHHKKRSHLPEIHIDDTTKTNQLSNNIFFSQLLKLYFQIFVLEYLRYPQVCNTVHHRIKLPAHPMHKQHEPKLILMLAKMDYNDLLLDTMHKSI